ncbi:MAG: hypothetical protein CMP14_03420 [Rickettsiales bacterium]|nr:hypothetical protein [Rickettsiales bacterium]
MELFSIPNLSASQVSKTKPWKLKFELPKFRNKSEYKQWAAQPNTKYLAYSTAEGVDPNRRVNTSGEDGNPMRYLHGVCVDWDATFKDEEFEDIVRRLLDHEYPVNYISRSYNGGIHAVWFFESPIYMHGSKSNERFLRRLAKELKLEGRDAIARGFDLPNFVKQHYLLHGHSWRAVKPKARIASSELHYWQFETSKSADFRGQGPEIPLDVVFEEVKKVWPEHKWPGEFVEGSRGPTYWDPGGQHQTANAAIVRDTGMQVFNMPKGFYTWAEILSPGFVRQYEVGRIGEAVASYWTDGKNYFIEDGSGDFFVNSKDDALLDLQCRHDLSARPGRHENVSEARRALHMINTSKRIAAGIPFCFTKSRIVTHEHSKYFNTARIKPLTPADEAGEWGEHFPTIAEWMEHMLGEEQLPYELAWLNYAYKNALAGKPRRGHAHFLVGPPNCGKTLYNTTIFGGLFGGGIKASEYLTGKDDWTDYLFEFGAWLVDDEAPTASTAMHTAFTARLKEHIANDTFLIKGKYVKSGRAYWRGRISCTLNDDPVSMRLLPDLDMSIKDKLMVFKCNDGYPFTQGTKGILIKELPAFAAWLLAHDPPPDMHEVRFGVKAYVNEDLEEKAKADSRYSHMIELLSMFRKTLKEDCWEGTCSELMVVLSANENNRVLLKEVSPKKLGWGLRHMESKGFDWVSRSEKLQYGWKIC